jgi:hypothetical protein
MSDGCEVCGRREPPTITVTCCPTCRAMLVSDEKTFIRQCQKRFSLCLDCDEHNRCEKKMLDEVNALVPPATGELPAASRAVACVTDAPSTDGGTQST